MAESPSHKFGQILGNLLEEIMQPLFAKFCKKHTLYLDFQGKERTARKGKKVTWKDKYGNLHDLDYVIEKGGTDSERGKPIAFWRDRFVVEVMELDKERERIKNSKSQKGVQNK